jgi:hypothetical protein
VFVPIFSIVLKPALTDALVMENNLIIDSINCEITIVIQ